MSNQKYLLTSANSHSGFSNKVHAWANAYYLAQQNNMIIVQDWTGDSDVISLPNTVSISTLEKDIEWSLFDTNSLKNSDILPDKQFIKLTCGFNYNRCFFSKINHKALFQQISFNHPCYSDIVELCNDPNLVGVHIRRSDFYPPTLTDSDFVGINSQVHEKWFVSVMKDLKKINDNVRFYIATENLDNFIHLRNKFNVVDRTIFDIPLDKRPPQNHVLCLQDFVDLFVLTHVKCFIETPRSSYSHLASLMSKNSSITSTTYSGYFYHSRNY
jgi:hypothetical protein